MIKAAPKKYTPLEVEKRVSCFWKEGDIFRKSIENRKTCAPFVFLEGPPTANGMPHPGHVLTRVMKDLFNRYKTMQGHYVLRKAGWDTHGLPVEIEVEKKLGLKDKTDIEAYGIAKFNEHCRESVFHYEKAWREMSSRLGYWLDMDDPYITLKNDYIESVWWSLKEIWKKGLLYRGHKVIPYCPRCGTALSSHEVAQGYKEISDPSVFVKFRMAGVEPESYFLAWTTTPWTLISNVALAVHPRETYARIKRGTGELLVMAETRAKEMFKNEKYEVVERYMGSDLEGMRYEPLYDFAKPDKPAHFVTLAEYVTMEDGSGIVHIAPAFGEDDYEVGKLYGLPVIQLVNLDGTFPDAVTPWKGMFVKDADEKIIEDLKARGLLVARKMHKHQYPFCWRCDSPLIYYARESWFIAMSRIKDDLVANNENVNWVPAHVKEGRFGSFISDVRDWALSRDRYWGTPLPIWTCGNEGCRHQLCVGGIEELRSLSKNAPNDLDLHKPYVDELDVRCPKCGGAMQRTPEVIDTWYDSGSAPFAQWHYPFENREKFEENFPADFISEAIDQTRGWFYSLMAISTAVFNRNPYRNVLVMEFVLDKDGNKMSKSKRNYLDPMAVFDREGADATRWYFASTNAPWMPKRFYEDAIKEALGKFILTLWNTYGFFTSYAELDGFDRDPHYVPAGKRPLLDRWLLSRFNSLVREATLALDSFEPHRAARAMENFVIEDLSNWYVRRSRKRFWSEEMTADKRSAYSTMWEVLSGVSALLAPFIPFIAEEIYQNLRTGAMAQSVHLTDYPSYDEKLDLPDLERGMERIRELAEGGRALRAKVNIKVRQPLFLATLVCPAKERADIEPLLDILKEEINVKEVEFAPDAASFMEKTARPNPAKIGPTFKADAGKVKAILDEMGGEKIAATLSAGLPVKINLGGSEHELDLSFFKLESHEKEGIGRMDVGEFSLMLDTHITDELRAEGLARELVRRIQEMRKEADLHIEDRIGVLVNAPGEWTSLLGDEWIKHIAGETRASSFGFVDAKEIANGKEWDIEGDKIIIEMGKA
ncbi:MAG: isoleucine--tRNA ligase [Thermoplasmata archaeon HGW-Thermoplasmata-1]|nr:MAG: isoleucine--tRNA ligase [Thermoplasmata archaeon HGW-Thermoplasmata-1]